MSSDNPIPQIIVVGVLRVLLTTCPNAARNTGINLIMINSLQVVLIYTVSGVLAYHWLSIISNFSKKMDLNQLTFNQSF